MAAIYQMCENNNWLTKNILFSNNPWIGGILQQPHEVMKVTKLDLVINKPRAHLTVLWVLNRPDQELSVYALFMSSRLTLDSQITVNFMCGTHQWVPPFSG